MPLKLGTGKSHRGVVAVPQLSHVRGTALPAIMLGLCGTARTPGVGATGFLRAACMSRALRIRSDCWGERDLGMELELDESKLLKGKKEEDKGEDKANNLQGPAVNEVAYCDVDDN